MNTLKEVSLVKPGSLQNMGERGWLTGCYDSLIFEIFFAPLSFSSGCGHR